MINFHAKFCYILEVPEINKFIDIGNFFYKIYKKILFLGSTLLLLPDTVNQQETKDNNE